MILMFGVTGRIGRWMPLMLHERGEQVRAVVRYPAAAREILGQGASNLEFIQADATKPELWGRALAGVDRVYLALSTGNTRDEIAVVDAIATSGCSRIVKVSGLGAAPDCTIPMGREHYLVEQHIEQAGLQQTALRPSLMMPNLLGESRAAIQTGRLPSAAGNGRISWVHARDVAAVAVAALTQSGHEGQAYDVTGPEALTYHDLARILTSLLGRTVIYCPITDDEYARQLREGGFPETAVEHLIAMYRNAVRTGYFDTITDVVPSITGAPARTFGQWVQENAESFSVPALP